MSMCIYRAVDRQTQGGKKTKKQEKNLCTECGSVSVLRDLGVEMPHAAREGRATPLDIYTVNRADSYSTH